MKSRTDFQKSLDGELTKELNNNSVVILFMKSAVGYIADELGKSSLSKDIIFFVKGGTSINLLLELNKEKTQEWSDWDTQLVINPGLPADEWYKKYNELETLLGTCISNIQSKWDAVTNVDQFLDNVGNKGWDNIIKKYNNYNQIKASCPISKISQSNTINTFYTSSLHPLQELDTPRTVLKDSVLKKISEYMETEDGDDFEKQSEILKDLMESIYKFTVINLDDKTNKYKYSSMVINQIIRDFVLFRLLINYSVSNVDKDINLQQGLKTPSRAELLDISIPRRDTAEAKEHWNHVQGQLIDYPIGTTTFKIPNWSYHLEENIKLIIENLEGTTHSGQKIGKRITRGLGSLLKTPKDVIDNYSNDVRSYFPTTAKMALDNADPFIVFIYAKFLEGIYHDLNLNNNKPLIEILDKMYAESILEFKKTFSGTVEEKFKSVVGNSNFSSKYLEKVIIEGENNGFEKHSFFKDHFNSVSINKRCLNYKDGIHNLLLEIQKCFITLTNNEVNLCFTGDYALSVHLNNWKKGTAGTRLSNFTANIYLKESINLFAYQFLENEIKKYNNNSSQDFYLKINQSKIIVYTKKDLWKNNGLPQNWPVCEISIIISDPPPILIFNNSPVLTPLRLINHYDKEIGKKRDFHQIKYMTDVSKQFKAQIAEFE